MEEREDRDAFVSIDLGQRRCCDREQAAPGRRQRPLPARVGLHLDAVAHHGTRQACSSFFLVEIARLDGQHVQLVPRRRQHTPRGRRVELGALAAHDLALGVAHVVAEHGAGEPFDGGIRTPLGQGLHRAFTLAESG